MSSTIKFKNAIVSQKSIEPQILKKYYTKEVTVPGGIGTKSVFYFGGLEKIDGYDFIGILPIVNGFADQWVVSYSIYGDYIIATITGFYPVELTNTLSCSVLYIKK